MTASLLYFFGAYVVSSPFPGFPKIPTQKPWKLALRDWWRRQDLNLRTPERADLQSAAIDHSATPPHGLSGVEDWVDKVKNHRYLGAAGENRGLKTARRAASLGQILRGFMAALLVFLISFMQLALVLGSFALHSQNILYMWLVYGSPFYLLMNLIGSNSAFAEAGFLYVGLIVFHLTKYFLFFLAKLKGERPLLFYSAVLMEALYLVMSGYYIN
jgi:hypothetical protein